MATLCQGAQTVHAVLHLTVLAVFNSTALAVLAMLNTWSTALDLTWLVDERLSLQTRLVRELRSRAYCASTGWPRRQEWGCDLRHYPRLPWNWGRADWLGGHAGDLHVRGRLMAGDQVLDPAAHLAPYIGLSYVERSGLHDCLRGLSRNFHF